nr:phage terminase large subunit family protein [uncultured Cohaesibacter sp.]
MQPHEIIAATIDSARPPMRMSIPDAAVAFRRVESASYRGPWRHEDAPYLVEPMKVMGSRRFTAMVFIGPARTIKTEGLILNAVAHGVMCNPRPMKIVHITEKDADTFSEKKLDVMIEASPEIKARLERGTGTRPSKINVSITGPLSPWAGQRLDSCRVRTGPSFAAVIMTAGLWISAARVRHLA